MDCKVYPIFIEEGKSKRYFPRRVSTIFPQKIAIDLKPKVIVNSFLTLIVSIISIIIALVQNSNYESTRVEITSLQLYLRFAFLSFSVIQICLLMQYWSLQAKINIAFSRSYSKSGIIQGNNSTKLILFEFAICLIVYPYSFNVIIYEDSSSFVSLDDVITIFSLFRCYFFFKFLYDTSYYNSNRAQWIANLENVSNIIKFTLKSQLNTKMFKIAMFILILSVAIFGAAVKIIEKENKYGIQTYSDAVFLIAVTETTVGYGDTLPSLLSSRVICLISCLLGVSLVALIIISVQTTFELDDEESAVYNMIKYDIDCQVLRTQAINIIKSWWVLQLKRKSKANRFVELLKFSQLIKRFKIRRMQFKSKQTSNLKSQINLIEKVSKEKLGKFSCEFKGIEKDKALSYNILTTQATISLKTQKLKTQYKSIYALLFRGNNRSREIEKSVSTRMIEFNATEFKKQKDQALKKMIMHRSKGNSTSSG